MLLYVQLLLDRVFDKMLLYNHLPVYERYNSCTHSIDHILIGKTFNVSNDELYGCFLKTGSWEAYKDMDTGTEFYILNSFESKTEQPNYTRNINDMYKTYTRKLYRVKVIDRLRKTYDTWIINCVLINVEEYNVEYL